MLARTILMGLVMTIGSIMLFAELQATDVVRAGTVALTALAVFQWFNIWNCRSDSESIFTTNPLKNKFLAISTVLVILLHMTILYTSIGQKIFHTKPLSFIEWGGIVLVALSIIAVEEVRKFIYRRRLARVA
jgi:Ca2+-transporting ATPase